jgi:amidophosphoribosyltransferase
MCGIVGVVANYPIKNLLYKALNGVQHRGQQAAGMATLDGHLMPLRKGVGLIRQVITDYDLGYLNGNAGIGHVRFPTAGSADDPEQAHPFYVNAPFGIMLAHNGNLTNTSKLREEVLNTNHRHVRTMSDSEVLTNAFAAEIQNLTQKSKLTNKKIFAAITNVQKRLSGGYAVVSLIANYGLIGFRDTFGIRPLILGYKVGLDGFTAYMLASESCTLSNNGFTISRDINPGEAVIIQQNGSISFEQCASNCETRPCIFEFAYLARPDSIMENVPIQLARKNMGRYLANTIKSKYPHLEIDSIIAVPDSARTIAIAAAEELNVLYHEGFVRNHLMSDSQTLSSTDEEPSLINRLSPIITEFKDKNILLVDIAIVRGRNSREIVKIAKDAGAKKVYLAVATPPIRHSSVYGVDMPSHNYLIAHNKDEKQIADAIGADEVIYQELSDLKQSITDINSNLVEFEASCFDGHYITQDIDNEYLANLAQGIIF